MFRLAAFDLDGTLLNSDNAMSDVSADTVAALAASGVAVAVATARPYFSAMRHFEPRGLQPAAIVSGGADVRAAGGSILRQDPMPDAFGPFLADLADRADWTATLSAAWMSYRREARGATPAPPRPGLSIVPELAGCDLRGLLGALIHITGDDPNLAALDAWADRVTIHNAASFDGSPLLAITAAGVDKGTGLAALCAALGIEAAECVAFGDSDVDLPMFAVAGLSVATANASPRVLTAATRVTSSADDDGVALAIREIWPGI